MKYSPLEPHLKMIISEDHGIIIFECDRVSIIIKPNYAGIIAIKDIALSFRIATSPMDKRN
jgi:hypothetical protein